MDPVTTAIVAALAAGIVTSAGKVGENVIVDAYEALKAAIKHKLGIDSKVAKAVDALEQDPTSEGQKIVLKEQVTKAQADQDPDISAAAQRLLDTIKAQPGGSETIQHAVGSYIAQASHGSTANVNVNKKD